MWSNQPLKVYHGCDDVSANGIVPAGGVHGISLASGSPTIDFGQGFYTTTNVHQAEQWANRRYHVGQHQGATSAAVVEFTIDRDKMAGLEHMAFVREDFAPNSDYWQLVAHCRRGNDHARGERATTTWCMGRCRCTRSSWSSRTLTRSAFTPTLR